MNKLVTLDIETTGLDTTTDRIIQFSAIKTDPETGEVIDEYNSFIRPSGTYVMSIGAYIKHGIKPQDLDDAPLFKDEGPKIYEFLDGCDIITYNGLHCDIPFLVNEFARIGIDWDTMKVNIYDVYTEETVRNSHVLDRVYQKYFGKTMDENGLKAHDAMSDVKATYEVFLKQQQDSPYGPVERICADNFINNMDVTVNGKTFNTPCFMGGKYKYTPVKLVIKTDPKYITWCLNSSISESTKELIRGFFKK